MAKWYIDYGTVNEWFEGTLIDAMIMVQKKLNRFGYDKPADIWIIREDCIKKVYQDIIKPNAVCYWINEEPDETVRWNCDVEGYYGGWIIYIEKTGVKNGKIIKRI